MGGSRLAAGELTGQAAPIETGGAALIRTGRRPWTLPAVPPAPVGRQSGRCDRRGAGLEVLGALAQAPATATTPDIVPTSTSEPDSDGEAKCGSSAPRPMRCRIAPLAWPSS